MNKFSSVFGQILQLFPKSGVLRGFKKERCRDERKEILLYL